MRNGLVMLLAAAWLVGCGPQISHPNPASLDSALLPSDAPQAASTQSAAEPTVEPVAVLPMTLRSPAFESGGEIPQVHTCDGVNTSPELIWENVPQGTVALALVLDDPDAGNFVHWVAYDLPPEPGGLPAGLRSDLPAGGEIGANTWGRSEYGGPCPPTGTHRYVFTLYALDSELDLPPGATADGLLAAAEGHILAEAQLAGTYECG